MCPKWQPYKTYTREFKKEAVRLLSESDKPASELAMELGIRRNHLYKWKEQLLHKAEQALSSQRGRPTKENQNELITLRQETELLKEELEILKKPHRTLQRNSSEESLYQGTLPELQC